jgi:DNA-binding beta-propeller fold protein YncE
MRIGTVARILVCALLAWLTIGASDAGASRVLLNHSGLKPREEWLADPDEKKPASLEGACGVAVAPETGDLYVSDYYHRVVDTYISSGLFQLNGVELPGGRPSEEINTLDAVCGLALDSGGNLYGNELHQAVLQLLPDERVIDPGHATGVAVDDAGNLYVDDRTYIAVYEAPIAPDEAPVEKIGLSSLEDGYGLAVDSAGKTAYVADAGDDTVKRYALKGSSAAALTTIEFGFGSLVDAALAVDPTDGHLLVVIDSQPGSENPLAAIYEFDPAGNLVDRLSNRVVGESGGAAGPIFGEPSGIAVDPNTGDVFVTTGNGAGANLVKYGPFEPFAPAALSSPGGSQVSRASASAGASDGAGGGSSSASASEIVQRRGVRVRFDGKLTPRALPRHGVAPVGISVDAEIAATGDTAPPQLRQIAIAINRNGRFETTGLPVCRLHDIQPSTTANALATCRGALVGEGHFSANVKLPEQSPFPSAGKVLAFNGRLHGKPAILAHIYGTQPAPTSTVLPFLINDSRGTYGTVLEASLPEATGDWGYVTGLKMNLRRHFSYRGRGRSYLSAGCPAPAGFSKAAFPLARTSFGFAGGLTLVSILNRSCKTRG